jgi:hypothetical protein
MKDFSAACKVHFHTAIKRLITLEPLQSSEESGIVPGMDRHGRHQSFLSSLSIQAFKTWSSADWVAG